MRKLMVKKLLNSTVYFSRYGGKRSLLTEKTQKYKIVQKVSLRMWITIFEYEDYDGEVRN